MSNTETGPNVYVHVPKTAGSSLRRAVVEHYGAESVYIYSQATDKLIRADKEAASATPGGSRLAGRVEKMPRLARSCAVFAAKKLKELSATPADKAFTEAAAVIGHFSVDRFAASQTSSSARLYTVVREPLARMVSHYRNVQASTKIAGHCSTWASGQDSRLDFKHFALRDEVQNFQTAFTGIDIGRYAMVGTTENFDTFLRTAGLVATEGTVPHTNRAQGPGIDMSVVSDAGFMRDFQEFHAEDYAFYAAALGQQSSLNTRQ